MPNVIPCQPEMTFEQRERAIGMLTARMLADFSKLGTSRTDPDQSDSVKPGPGKTVFSRLHLDAIDLFLVES